MENLFNSIAPSYDQLNHLLSLGIDKIWRRKAVRFIKQHVDDNVLDIACGTADSTLALANAGISNISGCDIAEEMLKIGRQKVSHLNISLIKANCEILPFNDNTFNAITIFYGFRNFQNREQCLHEIFRVLKPHGTLFIIELSEPKNKVINFFYHPYFHHFLPWIGGMISKQKKAYQYLPTSVHNFPTPNKIKEILEASNFKNFIYKSFTFGICNVFCVEKP